MSSVCFSAYSQKPANIRLATLNCLALTCMVCLVQALDPQTGPTTCKSSFQFGQFYLANLSASPITILPREHSLNILVVHNETESIHVSITQHSAALLMCTNSQTQSQSFWTIVKPGRCVTGLRWILDISGMVYWWGNICSGRCHHWAKKRRAESYSVVM